MRAPASARGARRRRAVRPPIRTSRARAFASGRQVRQGALEGRVSASVNPERRQLPLLRPGGGAVESRELPGWVDRLALRGCIDRAKQDEVIVFSRRNRMAAVVKLDQPRSWLPRPAARIGIGATPLASAHCSRLGRARRRADRARSPRQRRQAGGLTVMGNTDPSSRMLAACAYESDVTMSLGSPARRHAIRAR
jgi:hypothetical protein